MNILNETPTKHKECFLELEETFSKEIIHKLGLVFNFYKQNAVDNQSLIRKLHLGYTAMRPEAFDIVAEEFPWVEQFREEYGLSKKLNFLETHGLDKPEFKLHIDGEPGKPHVMFNAPIMNCDENTVTYWVDPLESFTPVLACENGNSSEKQNGATPHLPENANYNLIDKTSFTNRCALFRSDIYHGVLNNSKKDEYRIMAHWWFPDFFTWKQSKFMFIEHV